MDSQSLNDLIERTHSLITAAREQVCLAKCLHEASHELRGDNHDLREFLFENRQFAYKQHERWVESELDSVPSERLS